MTRPFHMLQIVAALVLAAFASTPKAAKSLPVPVTAAFRCPLGADCPWLAAPDRFEGDSVGSYTGTSVTPQSTTYQGAYIDPYGRLLFELNSGYGRMIFLDFSQPYAPAPCGASCHRTFTTLTTDVVPQSQGGPVDAVGSLLPNGLYSLQVGQVWSSGRLKLNFANPSNPSLQWTIRFDPINYPPSTWVTITRTATNQWTFEGTSASVGKLIAATTTGRYLTYDEGTYVLPFKITITQ